jgi:hypothetical protein
MTDILLIVFLVAAPAALFIGWLAFLDAALASIDASRTPELDERSLLSPRPDLFRSTAVLLPR